MKEGKLRMYGVSLDETYGNVRSILSSPFLLVPFLLRHSDGRVVLW